jgi:hypothetical protein
LISIKVVIIKENYPEDKLTEDEQDLIPKETRKVFSRTPKEELMHPKSFVYVCGNQQSVQWHIKLADDQKLGARNGLKAMDARRHLLQ